MTTRTTIRSWPAMALSGVFLTGTSFVLFQDVLDGARLTTGHVLTALALLAATAAGHQIVTAWRSRRFALTVGLIILTMASLAYVATMSGARNAEQLVVKAEKIDEANRRRADVRADLEKGRADLQAEGERMARECRTGRGPRCAGVRETVERLESHVAVLQVRLERLGSPEVANAGYRQAAEAIVLTGLSGRTVDELERALIVLLPWLAVLISELGTIVFLSSALGHSVPAVPAVKPPVPANDPGPGTGTKAQVIDWVRQFQAKHGRKPKIPEVRARFQTAKTTSWRYIQAA